jgi:hypothetical protein
MDWLVADSPLAANQFGWLMGTATGFCGMAIVIVLIVSAPAYRADVPFAISEGARNKAQWVLFSAQLLLVAVWGAGAWHVGHLLFRCYVWTFTLGALAVVMPVTGLLMFASANWIGRAAAR